MNILEIKNITSSYNGHVAIENISFDIKENEYIFIVGENGSGKSTLVKTILGLHKQDKGKVICNINKNDISYLAQNNMMEIDFPATAKEIIMTGLQRHKKWPFYTKEDNQKYEKICKRLKIKEIAKKRIGDLSGGQRQRVLLARALIRNPKLIILDEPASGLDSNVTKELYSILDELYKETNLTIIMITHDLEDIKQTKARVICMAKNVKFDGKVKDWKGL